LTRATVKPSRSTPGCADHTFYVIDANREVPLRAKVEALCQELKIECGLTGRKGFNFSCIERNWRKEWGVGSASSTSSRAPVYEEIVER
jgi:hypothetical protein